LSFVSWQNRGIALRALDPEGACGGLEGDQILEKLDISWLSMRQMHVSPGEPP
jgi:hypothetical protein